MTKPTNAQRVQAGIAFLNVINPNWKKKISLRELDLANSNTCLIGEIYGEYNFGSEKIGIDAQSWTSEAMGFYESNYRKYPALTRAWKKALRKLGIKE